MEPSQATKFAVRGARQDGQDSDADELHAARNGAAALQDQREYHTKPSILGSPGNPKGAFSESTHSIET